MLDLTGGATCMVNNIHGASCMLRSILSLINRRLFVNFLLFYNDVSITRAVTGMHT